jgi:hypothetical protein
MGCLHVSFTARRSKSDMKLPVKEYDDMPTTARHARSKSGREDTASALGPSTALRIKVAWQRAALTGELAAGAPVGFSPEMALRASQLVSERRRRQLARAWRRTTREAHEPAMSRTHVSIIRRGAVIEAEDAIEALVARLNDREAVTVQGMAMLERLMTDGTSSPLFNPAEPGALRRQILVATEALDPTLAEPPLVA